MDSFTEGTNLPISNREIDVSGAVRFAFVLGMLSLLLVALGADIGANALVRHAGSAALNGRALLLGSGFICSGTLIRPIVLRLSIWIATTLVAGLCVACLWVALVSTFTGTIIGVLSLALSLIVLGSCAWRIDAYAVLSAIVHDRRSRWNSSYGSFLIHHLRQGGLETFRFIACWMAVVVGLVLWLIFGPEGNGNELVFLGWVALARYCYGRFTAGITRGIRIDEGHEPATYNLYLRSFFDDDMEMLWPGILGLARIAFQSSRFTEVIASIVWPYGPLVGVANSRSAISSGIVPTYFADRDWETQVQRLLRGSTYVLLVVSFTSNLIREFRRIIDAPERWKTLLVVPPESDKDTLQRWRDMTAGTRLAGITADLVVRTMVVRFLRPAGTVFVTARQRTTFSYRIALRVGLLSAPLLEELLGASDAHLSAGGSAAGGRS